MSLRRAKAEDSDRYPANFSGSPVTAPWVPPSGVTCVVVRDRVTSRGRPVEKTDDWYAQDKQGNVWYFGEDARDFSHGR